MGYFSNMTEAEIWQRDNCNKCAHWKDGGCPVDDAHMLFNYELCNAGTHPGKVILDLLIPRSRDDGFNEKCAMFIRRDGFSERQISDWQKYKAAMEEATGAAPKGFAQKEAP